MESRWPVQDAKQRLSELLRKAIDEGPQTVAERAHELPRDIEYAGVSVLDPLAG